MNGTQNPSWTLSKSVMRNMTGIETHSIMFGPATQGITCHPETTHTSTTAPIPAPPAPPPLLDKLARLSSLSYKGRLTSLFKSVLRSKARIRFGRRLAAPSMTSLGIDPNVEHRLILVLLLFPLLPEGELRRHLLTPYKSVRPT